MNIFKKSEPKAEPATTTWKEEAPLYYAVMKPDRLAAEMERQGISWEKLREKAWLFQEYWIYMNTYMPISIGSARRVADVLHVPLEEITLTANHHSSDEGEGSNTLEIYPGGTVILNGHPIERVLSVDVNNIGFLDDAEVTIRLDVRKVNIIHDCNPIPMKATEAEQEPEHKEDTQHE